MKLLKERGDRTDKIMTDLFKAYHVASDSEFVRYIKTKNDRYDYCRDMIFKQLMMEVFNKYKFLFTSVKWNTMYLEQDDIVALTSIVKTSRMIT